MLFEKKSNNVKEKNHGNIFMYIVKHNSFLNFKLPLYLFSLILKNNSNIKIDPPQIICHIPFASDYL